MRCSFLVDLLLQGQFLQLAFTLFLCCSLPLKLTNWPWRCNRGEMSKNALRNKKRREKQKEKKAAEASGAPADESWSPGSIPSMCVHRLIQQQIISFNPMKSAVCLVYVLAFTVYETDHSLAQTVANFDRIVLRICTIYNHIGQTEVSPSHLPYFVLWMLWFEEHNLWLFHWKCHCCSKTWLIGNSSFISMFDNTTWMFIYMSWSISPANVIRKRWHKATC